jgi:multiple sugar transport system ATP-binding protein
VSRIVLDGITKTYPDGTTAVRSLRLDVGDGELLVLVGPSGCGKTTALRMVAGLEEVTEGTIYIDDRPVNDVEPRHRDIAMVFQSYALYPHLSVYDNIAFSLKYRKIAKPEIRRRVAEAARILELEEHLQRKPRQLSGGQRQRVAMGRAIVRQPRAFLMDEPLSNLDAKLRVQMRGEIARLQRALGITTIYVTHDQTEAMTLGTRVAVISRGVLQQVAPPQELYQRPANLFVAGFIGSPAMNLMEARLERGAERGGSEGSPPRDSTAGPDVVFGGHRLKVAPQLVRDRPALERYLGRRVILGIRPENLDDAALVHDPDPESVIELPVELREELGSEVHVHCAIPPADTKGQAAAPAEIKDQAAAPADTKDQAAAPAGAEADAAEPRTGTRGAAETLRKTLLVARMDPRTTVREGEAAKIAVDLAALHFFDPDTGDRIEG